MEKNVKDNFIRVAAATPKIKVADPIYNREIIWQMAQDASAKKAKVIVFPELCLTGYTCGDLFLQTPLLNCAKKELMNLAELTAQIDSVVVVGLPIERNHRLYNVAAVLSHGKVLGLITKTAIPSYSEFAEKRHFAKGFAVPKNVEVIGNDGISYMVPMGSRILFQCNSMSDVVLAGEICEDVWEPNPPSIAHAMNGATVIFNTSACDALTGKGDYIRSLISGQSARLVCGYICANAGEGESTQDLVFSGHNIIAENGTVLSETKEMASHGIIYADMDLDRLHNERRRIETFDLEGDDSYVTVPFDLQVEMLELNRVIPSSPFIPENKKEREKRCEEIFLIQAMGLKRRLEHTNCKSAVIGISGGLDSTLALLVIARAFDMLNIPHANIQAITMPCFGTTNRTYTNACEMSRRLGATLTEVDIKESVMLHFKDIGHDPSVKNVTYENAQARERTQVLMDFANKTNGMVIGTGDMSELALGWATYNGDHMSMYGVNASVPKTLVRHLVRYYADTCEDKNLSEILYDVLDTPVSPELLPPEKDGTIAQKTEDLVGPYELHDFFLYYIVRYGYNPTKIYRMAKYAFAGEYDDETIKKWMRTFYWRFFAQQFKRSCVPDGPKVGSVALSPRGDLRMPSDACSRLWIDEVKSL